MYSSCVYGVQDLPRLMKQPHLVAHKFYLDFEPAGYFCVLKVSFRFVSLCSMASFTGN